VCALIQGTDLLKKALDVQNDDLIASRLDGVVPKEANAVLTVSDQVEASANRLGRGPVRDSHLLEGMIKELISPVLLVGRGAPIQSGSVRSVTTGPQSETGGAEARVR